MLKTPKSAPSHADLNYKEFTSLPENRNAALEPDAAGLIQLHTSYEDSVSWKPGHLADHCQTSHRRLSPLKPSRETEFPSLVSH